MAEIQERILRENIYGQKTSKNYPVHHNSPLMKRDESRMHHKQVNGSSTRGMSYHIECTPLQHGSPEIRRNYVYPSHVAPMPAFTVPYQEVNGISKGNPKVQESTLVPSTDTEQAVNKIRAMFPTVSDTHIRILLKKYHNREALVISALQVEKHPITTPGPYATPPPTRNVNIHPSVQATMTPPLSLHNSSHTGSPVLRPSSVLSSGYMSEYRNSPKAPYSPKLKLRYMKSIYPKADENIILDILYNNDNNIQKTSSILEEMGYQRREIVKLMPQQSVSTLVEEKPQDVEKSNIQPTAKIKSLVEKAQITFKLREKYANIPDHLITFALESVDFEEDKADQILKMMIEEEKSKEAASAETSEGRDTEQNMSRNISISHSRQSLKSLLIGEKNENSMKQSSSFSRVLQDHTISGFRSSNLQNTRGANPDLVKGPNRQLLLKSYVKCQGVDPTLHQNSSKGLAKGPNPLLLSVRSYKAKGSNPELQKGPKVGLAKGSIFSQLKSIIVGESRGK